MMPAMPVSSSANGGIPRLATPPDEAREVAVGDGVSNLPLRKRTADRIALSAVAGGNAQRRDPRRVRCRRRGIGCRGAGLLLRRQRRRTDRR